MDKNSALYYPSVEFRDSDWIKQAIFIWDRIYRIVPGDYIPKDNDFIDEMTAKNIIININPTSMNGVLKKVANKFMERLNRGYWKAAAFSLYKDHTGVSSNLHKDKVDKSLRTYLNDYIFQGCLNNNEEYLPIPQEFSALYMAYLANEILLKWHAGEEFSVITDNPALWTGNLFYNFEPVEQDLNNFNKKFRMGHEKLGAIIIKSCLPILSDISASDLIEIRKELNEPRTAFLNSMKEIADYIFKESGYDGNIDSQFLNAKLISAKEDIEAAVHQFGTAKSVTYAMPIMVGNDKIASQINNYGEDIITFTMHMATKQNLPAHRYTYLLDNDERFQHLETQEYTNQRLMECIHQFIVD